MPSDLSTSYNISETHVVENVSSCSQDPDSPEIKAAEVPEAFSNQEDIIKPPLPLEAFSNQEEIINSPLPLEAFSNQEETIKPPSPISVPNND